MHEAQNRSRKSSVLNGPGSIGLIDPSFSISHRYGLNDAAEAYDMFESKVDGCTKLVMKPHLYNERIAVQPKQRE